MRRVHKPDWRFWLRAVNALALILVAFAHAPIDLRAGEFQQAALQAMAAIAAPAQIRDTFDLRGPVVMASDDAVLRTFADWNSARPRARPSA